MTDSEDRLKEIKARRFRVPKDIDANIISDFYWLIQEVERLRDLNQDLMAVRIRKPTSEEMEPIRVAVKKLNLP